MTLNYSTRLFKLKYLDLDDDTTVAPAGSNSQTIQPAEGFIYQIIDICYYATDPAGSSAGTHEVEIFNLGQTAGSRFVKARARGTTGNDIEIGPAGGFNGDSSESPANVREQLHTQYGWLWASYDYPITVKYSNDTDVNQAATRHCEILVKEYREAE